MSTVALQIVTKPNAVLTTPCEAYQDGDAYHLENLVTAELMVATMLMPRKGIRGIGLAAPQVGVARRFFVMCRNVPARSPADLIMCFNPKILHHGAERIIQEEMCLSCPGEKRVKTRYKVIDVEYTTTEGKRVQETLRKLPARIFQHEMDHLNGILCIDEESHEKSNSRD